jgi:hypothetical protein
MRSRKNAKGCKLQLEIRKRDKVKKWNLRRQGGREKEKLRESLEIGTLLYNYGERKLLLGKRKVHICS